MTKKIIDAMALHKEAFVLDSHCDTPLSLMLARDFSKLNKEGHFDYPRMKKGGVDASFFAIYTSNSLTPDEATMRALRLIAAAKDSIEANEDKVRQAYSVRQARELKAKGLGAIIFGMENGAPIQKDLSLLRLFYRMGIRYLTLTHAGDNEICDSCSSKVKRWHGVSPFGREVIREMNRLGMLVDVSHISDESFYDVLKYSVAPVVATHSCCRELCNHPRNMTDQMIKDLAAAGGVIQINFYPCFLDEAFGKIYGPYDDAFDAAETELKKNPTGRRERRAYNDSVQAILDLDRPSYKRVVDHIDHVVGLVGVDHVGLGSDFDGIAAGPKGLEDISKMPVITQELVDRGYSETDIKKILGENFLRVMSRVEDIAYTF